MKNIFHNTAGVLGKNEKSEMFSLTFFNMCFKCSSKWKTKSQMVYKLNNQGLGGGPHECDFIEDTSIFAKAAKMTESFQNRIV